MSITTVQPVYDLGKRADYLSLGVGTKRHQHLRDGTDRLAPGFYCDVESVDAFIELGNRFAEANGRRVKAQSYVISFAPDELNVNETDDLVHAGGLAFLLAKEMHPNAPCLIVVHDDSKGRAVHAHITVLNHDTTTGLALRDYRVHWQVKRANDVLMREHRMRVVDSRPAPKHTLGYWQARREDLDAYEQKLGDTIVEALRDSSVSDMGSFAAACADRGVEVLTTEHTVKSGNRTGKAEGDSTTGLTYKMHDDVTPGKKPRMRRRKASALSREFTADALKARFTGPVADMTPAPQPVQRTELEPEKLEEFVYRMRRRMTKKEPMTPARERFVTRYQRQREYGD